MSSNSTSVVVQRDDSIAKVTLNRPEIRNAFDDAMLAELKTRMDELNSDPTCRVILICGAGSHFCAGANLDWMRRMADYSRERNLADAEAMRLAFEAVAGSPKATIAVVQGAAMGGGAGLAAACDIVIACESAQFAFSEVKLGIAPAVISPYVLQRLTPGVARALFVTGERVSAERALQIGLVDEVVADDALEAAAKAKADLILQAGPKAIAAVKQLLRDLQTAEAAEATRITVELIADLRVSEEGQEGIRAFLEKRRPTFFESIDRKTL